MLGNTKIMKGNGAEPDQFETSISQALLELELNSDLKSQLRELYITKAREIEYNNKKVSLKLKRKSFLYEKIIKRMTFKIWKSTFYTISTCFFCCLSPSSSTCQCQNCDRSKKFRPDWCANWRRNFPANTSCLLARGKSYRNQLVKLVQKASRKDREGTQKTIKLFNWFFFNFATFSLILYFLMHNKNIHNLNK